MFNFFILLVEFVSLKVNDLSSQDQFISQKGKIINSNLDLKCITNSLLV
jgi:hypothetical protein